ncbi:MAG: ParB/RepB/Spo0J family partition protein [Alphaproteobacteria bacterium]|nr:ParB/RepB/Spo0J family partition protein [Alphaproteobacteria bacterium]
MSEAFIDKSGVTVPADLTPNLVDIDRLVPNSWNPNSMDGFMREKLARSIRSDGFFQPVLVRPVEDQELLNAGKTFEIVDGEHRWRVALEDLGMTKIPVMNLGPISNAVAQQITIKANTLKGEFDSVKLAGIVASLTEDIGKAEVIDALPYTPERIEAMLALVNISDDDLTIPGTTSSHGEEADDEEADDGSREQFKSFEPGEMNFDHKCPRCGFEFNDPKAS